MGGALRFRLFGFPVTIDVSFLLLVAFLGYSSSTRTDRIVAFVVIAIAAILVHELGHAFAARSQGVVATPTITLAGMAGLTRYQLAAAPSRVQSVFISAAGPAAGVVAGLVVLAIRWMEPVADTGLTNASFDIALFTTFGWSAFNLLPIVPLDGGHILTDLIPGSPGARRLWAAAISIAVALAVGAWLWFTFELLFGPIILAMIAFSNVGVLAQAWRMRSVRSSVAAPSNPPPIRDPDIPNPPE